MRLRVRRRHLLVGPQVHRPPAVEGAHSILRVLAPAGPRLQRRVAARQQHRRRPLLCAGFMRREDFIGARAGGVGTRPTGPRAAGAGAVARGGGGGARPFALALPSGGVGNLSHRRDAQLKIVEWALESGRPRALSQVSACQPPPCLPPHTTRCNHLDRLNRRRRPSAAALPAQHKRREVGILHEIGSDVDERGQEGARWHVDHHLAGSSADGPIVRHLSRDTACIRATAGSRRVPRRQSAAAPHVIGPWGALTSALEQTNCTQSPPDRQATNSPTGPSKNRCEQRH